ncbi:alpha/beta hydrolase [Flammeovirga sp. SJP92]|uniref:alpha/beta hydrolase n=1 Tax=Flammeovirga sp. SJP92 TaxID=1775430 RepID=UPI001560D940|nr:alpha/beta hydrolase-fold protein [Flammeovirga sp. SJP92]
MKANLLIIIFSLIVGKVYCQDAKETQISIGHIEKIYSDHLQQERELYVHLPQSYSKKKEKKYPVVYLLDGESHFDYVSSMIKQLSAVNRNNVVPEMIVIGIKNINRWYDLTPEKDPFFNIETGNSVKFADFIEFEVMPYINKKYRTKGGNTIIGHSLGGLFVIHTMINSPELFDNYLSIDPTLWWLSNKYLHLYLEKFDKIDYTNKKLYFAIANGLVPGTDIHSIRNDTTQASYHMRSMLTFKDDFHKQSMNKLSIATKFYENETHGSLPLIATYDALRFFFSKQKEEQ